MKVAAVLTVFGVTCATAGATIHFTDNNVDPTEASPTVVSGGFVSVLLPSTLKVAAWKPGMTTSAVKSASYSPSDRMDFTLLPTLFP